MCSDSFPRLSHGVGPGPATYWDVGEDFAIRRDPAASGSGGAQRHTLTDAPHVAAGYSKVYVDRISRWMGLANDTAALPHQGRCVSFRRLEGH